MPLERLTPDKRRELTRSHLLAAAAQVFAEKGFHAATLDQIADAAGFSKGAVYSNFASKDELFLALIRQQGDSMVDAYAEVGDGEGQTASEHIAALADVYLRLQTDLTQSWALTTEFDLYALRNPGVLEGLRAGNRAVHEHVVDLLRAHFDADGVDPPLPVEDLASLYIAIFSGLWHQKALDPDSVPDELAAVAVDLVARAANTFGTAKKRRRRAGLT
ncbi:MAG TPA: TetR/AcrR family transcriptional regulator [Acidimicrobiales bacterium]|nr:TetR/AcrR family transcriptional regulator [Acidimicrobiales bacterium]